MAEVSSTLTEVSEHAHPSPLRRSGIFKKRLRLQTAEAQYLISYACVVLTVGIDFMGITIQNPLLPYYVKTFSDAKEMGIATATSILMFSYSLSQLIATPIFGFGSDRFGRRPMLLLSLVGTCLGFLAQGFAGSLMQLSALRFVTGLFGGSRPVALAYIGDTVPPEQQPKYMSGLALAVSASAFLGPVLGGSIGLVHLALPSFFQSGLAAVVFFLTWRYLKEPQRTPVETQGPGSAGGKENAAKRRPYRRWLVANALVGSLMLFVSTAFQAVLPVYGTEVLGLNQNTVGLLFGSSGLAIAFAQFAVYVPLARTISIKVLGCIGIPLVAVTAAVPLFEGKIWFVLLVCVLQGFGMALVMPNCSTTVNLLAPEARRGAMVSLTVFLQASMRVVAPLVTGPSYDFMFSLPFYMMLGACICAFILEALLIPRVPLLKNLGKKHDGAAPDAEVDEESERQSILQNLYRNHEDLTKTLEMWRERKHGLLAGKSREEVGLPHWGTSPSLPTQQQKHELGVWLGDMLWQHNLKSWPGHLDIIKCMCQNAFPKLPDHKTDHIKRIEHIEHCLESHLMLEQQWEKFVLQSQRQRSQSTSHLASDIDWSVVADLGAPAFSSTVDETVETEENGEDVERLDV